MPIPPPEAFICAFRVLCEKTDPRPLPLRVHQRPFLRGGVRVQIDRPVVPEVHPIIVQDGVVVVLVDLEGVHEEEVAA